MSDGRIIVFAKAPVAGRVKTRLAASIGVERAADLAARMLRYAVREASAAGVGPVELCCSPDIQHPEFIEAARLHGVTLTTQGEGDLGERMARAFRRALRVSERVLMMGSDCPALTAGAIREADEQLMPPRTAVLRPALDGGYVLIGLCRFDPTLFEGIEWSTSGVMEATRQRLRAGGREWWEGEPLPDIDEAEDLAHLPDGI